MRSTLTVGAEYLVHSGGTKYYEIATFLNEDAKKFIEVRRWGPMATAKRGSGQTQVLSHGTAAQALESVRKQLKVKRKEYADKPGGFGLHVNAGSQTLGTAYRLIGEHYADPELAASLRIATSVAQLGDEDEVEPKVPEKIQPEPDRGAQWGSW